MAQWNRGDDVVLQVAGKYTLLGRIAGEPNENGQVLVVWADLTRSLIRGELLQTPGEAAARAMDEVGGLITAAKALAGVECSVVLPPSGAQIVIIRIPAKVVAA